MLTILAAAAAMALPEAGKSLERDIKRDIPREVLDTNIAGAIYEAFADANGTIVKCKVVTVLGEPDASAKICGAIKGKQVSPARGPDGKPVAGYFRGGVSLNTGGVALKRFPIEPDVRLHVDELPGGAAKPVVEKLLVLVSAEGAITECEAADGESSALSDTACEEARNLPMPVRSAGGKPTSYVYPLLFEFTKDVLVAKAD